MLHKILSAKKRWYILLMLSVTVFSLIVVNKDYIRNKMRYSFIFDLYLNFKGNPYADLSLPSDIASRMDALNIKIRKPYNAYHSLDKEMDISFGTNDLKHHRYSNYYYELANYINDKDNRTRFKLIRQKYYENYDPLKKSRYINDLKITAGYHDLLDASYRVNQVRHLTNRLGHDVDEIKFEGRLKAPFTLFSGKPRNDSKPKGIVIAIHGRGGGPDYVMAMREKDDYSRAFGAYWLEKGYAVLAPQVDWSWYWDNGKANGFYRTNIPLEEIGYSSFGADLAKIEDVIAYAKKIYPDVETIITSGISYGAAIAELSAIFFKDVDAVISIGGNARKDVYLDSKQKKLDPEKRQRRRPLPARYYCFYQGLPLYKLIAPKPLVISIGTHDTGGSSDKFKIIEETVSFYKSIGYQNHIAINLFYASHEADPAGEYEAFESLDINKD